MSSLTPTAIREAIEAIDPVFLRTPQYESPLLNDALGCRAVCKIECLNPIRSFKGRGADYLYHTLDAPSAPLVTASAGNFGQGMAYAARRRGHRLIIFAATTASPLKLERMEALGAELHLEGDDFDAAKAVARAFAEEHSLRFIEDGREPAITVGAGTIAVELLDGGWDFDAALIPVGNGALIGGMGCYLKSHSPRSRVIGVAAEGAPAMADSFRLGRPVETREARTIADGIAVRVPVPEALEAMRAVVDQMMLVSDERLIEAMRLAHEALGLVLEPAGAAGLAAALEHRASLKGMTVAIPLCGGNVTTAQWRAWQVS